MTIHQMPAPCWVIRPQLPREDGDPHYDTRAEAMAAIRDAWDEDHWRPIPLRAWWREFRWRVSRLRTGAPVPRNLTVRCWLVQCDGDCELVLDTEGEDYVYHHGSAAEARKTVASYEWVYSADGRMVFCHEDAPEDGEEPPLTPAEQEAAGQLVLPGATP